MSKRKIYFEHFYRIWKVGATVREKRDFWEKNFADVLTVGSEVSDDHALYSYEEVHLDNIHVLNSDGDEILDAQWPSPYQIFVEKFYWDHGISENPRARLRYFKSHFVEHFNEHSEHYIANNLSDEMILENCQLFLIVNGHEVEIEPNFEL